MCRSRVCANELHTVIHRPVVCAVAIGFKTNIEAYFMEKSSARTPELLEVSKLPITFERSIFSKIDKNLKLFPYYNESVGIPLL